MEYVNAYLSIIVSKQEGEHSLHQLPPSVNDLLHDPGEFNKLSIANSNKILVEKNGKISLNMNIPREDAEESNLHIGLGALCAETGRNFGCNQYGGRK